MAGRQSHIFRSAAGTALAGLALWLIADVVQAGTQPCRLDGLANEVQCGHITRPLDPARPSGVQIDVHFLVVPAMARNKQPDAVLLLAGGPGQSAISLAPAVLSRLARLNNRRDLVFIDQRGTGKSAPLECADETRLPLAEALDEAKQALRLQQCRESLSRLPYGDMRFFTTTIAMQDFDAVREALAVPQWNLVGASYGTRAALEYLRQFPARVRRTVIDGVAPPDMVLPASFSIDGQAALDAVFAACDKEAACTHRYPQLRAEWQALLKSAPRIVSIDHPLTGQAERFSLGRETLLRSVRSALYVPAFAAALPAAIHMAALSGRFEGLLSLGAALSSGKGARLAAGMHFSVVCAEDLPRLARLKAEAGADFGDTDADFYRAACKHWPRGEVPAAFYTIPPAPSPVLLLSGGADPATPPRHGERVARALGAKAQHLVVPEAGHGVMGVACVRELLFRFVDAKTDAQALPQDAACASKLPRPPAFVTPQVKP
ncbi:alpha/beta fold hydrolase [soil metagenome]